jgi:hypothetical protein
MLGHELRNPLAPILTALQCGSKAGTSSSAVLPTGEISPVSRSNEWFTSTKR